MRDLFALALQPLDLPPVVIHVLAKKDQHVPNIYKADDDVPIDFLVHVLRCKPVE